MLHHYRPYDPSAVSETWRGGCIVLDANVLLHLYRVDEKVRDALFAILEDPYVASRLWFPYQAVFEFYKNRTTVITQQLSSIDRQRDRVVAGMTKAAELESPRTHFEKTSWQALIERGKNELLQFLERAKANYPASIAKDPILERLERILDGRVGVAPDERARSTLMAEGARRQKENIPPGYKDKDKDPKEPNGDYLIWAQCLEHCSTSSVSLLLVTDDAKEDWLLRTNGMTVGPRPELRAEFHTTVPGREFVLAPFDYFLEQISKYAKAPVEPEVLGDARQFVESLRDAHAEEDQQAVLPLHGNQRRTTSKAAARRDVDAMVRWFFERYEDPAQGVPYDGREGGYQYISGGPFNAREVLLAAFDNDTPRMRAMIETAVKRIEAEGVDWVEVGEY